MLGDRGVWLTDDPIMVDIVATKTFQRCLAAGALKCDMNTRRIVKTQARPISASPEALFRPITWRGQ